jgi:hypothetical protein
MTFATNSTMSKAVRFALDMRKIPRATQRCPIYGTVSVIVDRRHATNIIRKFVPTVSTSDLYDALVILQDRLDEKTPLGGW